MKAMRRGESMASDVDTTIFSIQQQNLDGRHVRARSAIITLIPPTIPSSETLEAAGKLEGPEESLKQGLSDGRLHEFGGMEEVVLHFKQAAFQEGRNNLFSILLDWAAVRIKVGMWWEQPMREVREGGSRRMWFKPRGSGFRGAQPTCPSYMIGQPSALRQDRTMVEGHPWGCGRGVLSCERCQIFRLLHHNQRMQRQCRPAAILGFLEAPRGKAGAGYLGGFGAASCSVHPASWVPT